MDEKLKEFLASATPQQLEETKWLLLNPDFEERPVDIETFVNHPDYLNLEFRVTGNNKGAGCRPRILSHLINVFDINKAYDEFVFCCGIGWGKDFTASIVLCYRLYLLACLKSPQTYFGLAPGSSIHLMLMSINETHARDVLFGEVKARIENSPWFRTKFKFNPKLLTSMEFPKNIYLIPGNSKDTSFVGYNIFTAIIDEGDDYVTTANRSDADEGYNAIKDRIVSRFRNKGLLGIIGSPKTEDGFMMTKFKNKEKLPNRYCIKVPTWDSLLDTPLLSGEMFWFREMEIPIEYRQRFLSDPERALRDLGARPSKAKEPFLTLIDKIYAVFDAAPILYEVKEDGISFARFVADIKPTPGTIYYGHLDLALNKGKEGDKGDRLGFAFGHVDGFKLIETEEKPIIRIDMAAVFTAPPGQEIKFDDIKLVIQYLVDKGFLFEKITCDSWNSADMIQSLIAKGVPSAILSVDKSLEPYVLTKHAMYEGRLMCHEYDLLKGEFERLELVNGEKVDHPSKGSKDCSDAVAGVVYNASKSNTGRIISFAPNLEGLREF
jgi:hypothetical protein